jgi:tRNA A-37 threonylcarbamoyl transferase component Bud32
MDERIDFDVLLSYLNKPYSPELLDKYLVQIYDILRDNKGLHKITLMRYLKTNPLFAKRLMSQFAESEDYMKPQEFTTCIKTIYTRDFETAVNFAYEFLKVGKGVEKCDIDLILYHMLKEKSENNLALVDRSVDEWFGNFSSLSGSTFRNVTVTRYSEPLVIILLYFYERVPFTIASLEVNYNDKNEKSHLPDTIRVPHPSDFLNYFIDYSRLMSYISTMSNTEDSDDDILTDDDDEISIKLPQSLVLKNAFTENGFIKARRKNTSRCVRISECRNDSSDNLNNTTRELSLKSQDLSYQLSSRAMIRDKNNEFVWIDIQLVDNDLYYRTKDGNLRLLINLPMVYLTTQDPVKKQLDEGDFFMIRLYQERYYDILFESRDECTLWIDKIKQINGARNLDDHYVILKKIAHGVSSHVHMAVDKVTGKKYVIKTINKTSLNKKLVELAYNELYILQTCKHPGIVTYIDSFETLTTIDIVMECLGDSLNTYIKANRMNSERDIYTFHYSIAKAIQYYQKLGIVHRDIKPSNICISRGEPQIIDFGVSDLTFKSISLNFSCGTGLYISPEVYLNKPYDGKADIWAFGILIFTVLHYYLDLVDENSFRTDLEDATRNIIYHKETFSMTIQWGKRFRRAQGLITKCLERNVTYRYSIDDIIKHCLFADLTECIN